VCEREDSVVVAKGAFAIYRGLSRRKAMRVLMGFFAFWDGEFFDFFHLVACW